MNTTIKTPTLASLIVLILALTACGGKGGGGKDDKENSPALVLDSTPDAFRADINGAPSFDSFFDGFANDGSGETIRFETPLEVGDAGAAFGSNAEFIALTNSREPNASGPSTNELNLQV